jgi:hypothetical protein
MKPGTSWEDIEAQVIEKSVTDADFRQRLLKDPRGTLAAELRTFSEAARIPDFLEIKVIQETPQTLHIVVPPLPDEELEEEMWQMMDADAKPTRRSCTCSTRCCV